MALGLIAVALIAALHLVAPRLGVAPQIILVAAGAAMSYLPGSSHFSLSPEIVLVGLLPLLLYASSLALPTIEFRRDLTAIGALSIALVMITALGIGWVIHMLVPGLPLAIGVALGALISPTDAAATGIVKRLGLSSRVLAILDGESLLNDASALVMARAGLAAAATGFSLLGAAESFIWAVVAAVGIGFVVGRLGVALRSRINSPAIASVVSLLVPFASYLPADLVRASGLVAVVAAGITTRQASPGRLHAVQRMTEDANWGTVEFLAEGIVFMAMGWQLKGLLTDLTLSNETYASTLLVAAIVWALALAMRAVFITGLVALASSKVIRRQAVQNWWHRRDQASAVPGWLTGRFARVRIVLGRYAADIEYLIREPLHAREGVVLTWAGLRGVVTVAGAQMLPLDLPHRPLIVLIAYTVAVWSLLAQGLTLNPLARRLGLIDHDQTPLGEADRLDDELESAALTLLDSSPKRADGSPFDPALLAGYKARMSAHPDDPTDSDSPLRAQFLELRLMTISAERTALLKARALGHYSSATLQHALNRLDADELSANLNLGDDT